MAAYVKDRGDAQEFLERYVPVIQTVGAGYLREGKRFMTVAIGCTGGKHRSVAMTEEIVARLRAAGLEAEATHRDLGGSSPRALVDGTLGRRPRRWPRARGVPDRPARASPPT